MSKTKVAAVTVVSLGMVTIAGIAGFAVVGSSQASTPAQTITLLANENPVNTGPTFIPGELPPIVTFDQSSTRTLAQKQAEAAATIEQPLTSTSKQITSESPRSGTSKTPEISALQARTAVLSEVKGTVTSVTEVSRNGFEAFAVKVALNDGGTATGYVHKATGVVFDWDVVGAPPAQTTSNGSSAKAPTVPVATSKKDDDDDHAENEHKSSEQKRPSSSHDDDDD